MVVRKKAKYVFIYLTPRFILKELKHIVFFQTTEYFK